MNFKIFLIVFCTFSLQTLCLEPYNSYQNLTTEYFDIFKNILEQEQASLSVDRIALNLFQQSKNFLNYFVPETSDYQYWQFIPKYAGNVKVGQNLKFEAPCFKDTEFSLDAKSDGSYDLNLSLEKSSSLTCTDFYLLAYHGEYFVTEYFFHGKKVKTVKKPANDAFKYDIETNGVRVFHFPSGIAKTLVQIADTASLFVPEATQSVWSIFAKRNVDFLKNYPLVNMEKRDITDVEIDESLVHSGDFIGIIRLDGLDPMLAWGMGSTTGHTTVAQRIDGVLHICESQAKGSYWDINGVQCTLFKTWLEKAKKANFNVIWSPLSDEMRALYDENKSYEYFKKHEGINYGYPVLLVGWLDTLNQNLPCMPNDLGRCLVPELLDVLFTIVESVSEPASIIWKQAMGQRAGLSGSNYSISEAYHQAGLKGIKNTELYQIPEQDEWLYEQDRYGNSTVMAEASVCCVFVCRMWKAAGIFQDKTKDINCAEFTNTDVYKLDVFQKNFKRPDTCVKADPENPICQLLGDYTLRLDVGPGPEVHYNKVQISSHMCEHCPSQNPTYHQEDDC